MTGHPADFDAETIGYLKELDAGSGTGHYGVFVRGYFDRCDSPRSFWMILVLLGLCSGIAAISLSSSPGGVLTRSREGWMPFFQSGLIGMAIWLLLVGLARYHARGPMANLKSFLFADGAYLWDVAPLQVRITPLEDLAWVTGQHWYSDGSYTHTEMTLAFQKRVPPGTTSFIVVSMESELRQQSLYVSDQAMAERLLDFLQAQLMLRNSPDEAIQRMAHSAPGSLAALAIQLLDTGSVWPAAVAPNCPNPPSPTLTPADQDQRRSVGGGWRRLLAAATASCLAFPGFAAVNRLALDDHEFQHAMAMSEKTHTAAPLRDYLANARNHRHRDEVRMQIAEYYDQTIRELKQRATERAGIVDPELVAAILAVLEAMKQADHPFITVGFKDRLDPLPPNEFQKDLERRTHDEFLRNLPELQTIADRQPDKKAIIPMGKVFDPDQVTLRQKLILSRLEAALQKGIKHEVLAFGPVAPGQAPVFEVEYHIFPSGQLYVYTHQDTPTAQPKLKGLLRGYDIRWVINVRPPQGGKSFVCTLATEPLQNLHYDARPGDPDWAPYAVILYSSFHELSGRLIRNFGLDPGPAPNAFSFAAVATTKTNPFSPDLPGGMEPKQP